jgi:asparagine synthase (glutamine-hydrolysing)
MQPRGPDMSSLFIRNNVVVGFHRLAINDTSVHGMQPFLYTEGDETFVVVCNGELYNHDDLKKKYSLEYESNSDCGIIFPLFKFFGYDFYRLNKELNGEYAMCILRILPDGSVRYYMSTDPLSVRPLFVSQEEEYVCFSSLQKGIPFAKSTVRVEQGTFVKGAYPPFPNTVYSFESYLEPVSVNHRVEHYGVYSQIVRTLEKCIQKRIENMDTEFGCLLSGGLDSSLVSAIAQRFSKSPIHTFTIGVEGSPDVLFAEKVAKHIKSNHTVVPFDFAKAIGSIDDVIYTLESYDITTVRASVGQYLIAKYIAENTNIKVILNGDGADEVQMGYLYFFKAPSIQEADAEQKRLLDNIHKYDGLRVDRCISNAGLEARLPFLDYTFVELYKQISAELKVPSYKGIEKYLIRRAFAAEYADDPILPYDVLWRTKEAFSDGISKHENSWFSILQAHFEKIVSDEEFKENTYYPKPPTKEAYYYHKVYERLFGQTRHVHEYWMPKWSSTNDPSARTLDIYQVK